ncbi:hypothetical protein NDU88_006536 [Pleurodeles waltl]|uniref:Uncharacterized protein n=1 Tax=Pleurodeles waltl TaxID=8319 RepID=A0AAV7UMS6_PLEWA|nr:hypothetical protein NDU88_006536 [Pleurodeles waltl]
MPRAARSRSAGDTDEASSHPGALVQIRVPWGHDRSGSLLPASFWCLGGTGGSAAPARKAQEKPGCGSDS